MLRTMAVLLLGILACSDSPVVAPLLSEPEPPRVPTPAPILAVGYTLVLVNGAPLPSESPVGAGQWDYDGAVFKLVDATLAFYIDGTLLESWSHRRTLGGRSERITQTFNGRYTRISYSTLQMGVGEGASFVTLTATGLVWQMAGFTLTYEQLK